MKKAFLSCAAAATLAGCGGAQPSTPAPRDPGFATMPRVGTTANRYRFRTLDNSADPTYNDLTGISNAGVISGYYGSGQSDPSKGYTLAPPYTRSSYTSENYPGSTQTQVASIDNLGNTVGDFVDKHGRSWGFVKWNGAFKRFKRHPLYGLNNAGNTVVRSERYYSNAIYTLNQATRKRTLIYEFSQGTARGNGLNDAGDVVGSGYEEILGLFGWAIIGGVFYGVAYGRAGYGYCPSVANAINNTDEIVGWYSCGREYIPQHGFVLTNLLTNQYETVDYPNGTQTTINGINDKGELVGTYVDGAGNTHGFLAKPR